MDDFIKYLPEGIFAVINAHPDRYGNIFLVGGAVRDYLDGKTTKDFDFIVEKNASFLARSIANHTGGVFYFLDRDREIARVLVGTGKQQMKLDFARQVGGSLEEDLRVRDFTVNAMAVSIHSPFMLIDPLNGKTDLKNRYLRMCASDSIRNEPVRALRAVRFITQNSYNLLPETDASVREAAFHISTVSPERVRDELFKILAGENTSVAIKLMDALGLLNSVFPELCELKNINPEMPSRTDTFGHTLYVLEFIDHLLKSANSKQKTLHAHQHLVDDARLLINNFPIDWQALSENPVCFGRPTLSLLKLAILYHDTGKSKKLPVQHGPTLRFPGHESDSVELVEKRGRALILANREISWLKKLVASHMLPRSLEHVKTEDLNRNLFRLFQSADNTTPFLACFYLADVFGAYGTSLTEARWKSALESSRMILDAWCFHQDKYRNLTPYLDGSQIQALLGIPPDERTGRLRTKLLEEQAAGIINSIQEAKQFIRRIFNNQAY